MRLSISGLALLVLSVLIAGPLHAQVRRDASDFAALPRRESIVISPRSVTLSAGASEQFSATTMGDAEVRWSATGGTITPTGVYVAGSTPGSYMVVARAGTASAAVSVVVVARTGSSPAATTPVAVNPGESIQRAVDSNPEGTSFLIKKGVHRRQTIKPKSGMSFIGEAGAVLDGENVTPVAFAAPQSRSVTIRGLRVTRYAPGNTAAAVDAIHTHGWVIEGNEVDSNINGANRAYGVRIGSNGVVRGNSIHHNGFLGIECYKEVNTLIENNEVYANPPTMVNDSVGEAANMKFFDCGQMVIRGNHVHDGLYRGIWVDTSRPDMTVEGNRVINHGRQGIWYEVSYRGTIRNNYVENAGFRGTPSTDWPTDAAILVSNSPDVSVLNNTVVNSVNAIMGHQADSYVDGKYGKNELRNFLVQGNTLVMPRGQTGIVENRDRTDIFVSWNNRFVNNRYVLGSNRRPFSWMGQTLDERQWQAYGVGTSDAYTR